MAGSYKARGIVLHTVKYGESSLVAYLFTDVGGRQTYMIQGVRSSRGRGNKAALFQPMFLLEFEGVEQPHAEMHRMKEVRNLVPLCHDCHDRAHQRMGYRPSPPSAPPLTPERW